jgi:hypothetical protein
MFCMRKKFSSCFSRGAPGYYGTGCLLGDVFIGAAAVGDFRAPSGRPGLVYAQDCGVPYLTEFQLQTPGFGADEKQEEQDRYF